MLREGKGRLLAREATRLLSDIYLGLFAYIQDLEERREVEIKVYKQRVKHLLYDHENELTEHKKGRYSR